MAIFMFGGQNGGSGKSTLATNLSVCLAHKNLDAILVDTDPQATSSKWIQRRNDGIDKGQELPTVNCAQRTGNVYKTILDLASRYDHVIIDAGGNDNEAQRTAMTIADILFLPLKASQVDLETLPYMCELISIAQSFNPKLRVVPVLSMVPTNPSIKEADCAKKIFAEFSEYMQASKIIVHERKVYRDTMLDGLGVIEDGNLKAIQEVNLLTIEAMRSETIRGKANAKLRKK